MSAILSQSDWKKEMFEWRRSQMTMMSNYFTIFLFISIGLIAVATSNIENNSICLLSIKLIIFLVSVLTIRISIIGFKYCYNYSQKYNKKASELIYKEETKDDSNEGGKEILEKIGKHLNYTKWSLALNLFFVFLLFVAIFTNKHSCIKL